MRQPGRFLLVAVALAAALSLAGCGGRIWTRVATASLQTVEGDLEYAQLQTRETMESLDELLVAHENDLGRVYQVFSQRVDRVTVAGKRLLRHAEGMEDQGRSYLVEPEKSAGECQYPRLSEGAGTRPLELGWWYIPISGGSALAKRSYREFDSDITKIRDSLAKQLNRVTVEAVGVIIRKAQADGENLNHALELAQLATHEAATAQKTAASATVVTP